MSITIVKSESLLPLLRFFWSSLTPGRRRQLVFLALLMVFNGFAELIAISSMVPFLTIISNPQSIYDFNFGGQFLSMLTPLGDEALVLSSAFLFAIAITLASVGRVFSLKLTTSLGAEIASELGCDAYRKTLYQPFESHLGISSSSVINTLTTQVSRCAYSFMGLLQMISAVFVSFGVFAALFIINAAASLLIAGTLCILYVILSILYRPRLKSNSSLISRAGQAQVQALQEGLGSIKQIILSSSQKEYLDLYSPVDIKQRKLLGLNVFLSAFPRYVFEGVALVVVSVVGAFFALSDGGVAEIIPLIGVLALGAQRLLPALQQIYGGWAALSGSVDDFKSLKNLLSLTEPITSRNKNQFNYDFSNTEIELENVGYSYPVSTKKVLQGINLCITPGQKIGLIGSTGSGKSTLANILISLLEPSTGVVKVGGKNIHHPQNVSLLDSYRNSIAYVPQSVFLMNCSIYNNIAFLADPKSIDHERIEFASKAAQIDQVIKSLPRSYDTKVGERGVNLSGGQIQRLGIARALYKDCKILVLDEATSALDVQTEQILMNTINQSYPNHTIFIIAHRLATLKSCDRVISLNGSKIVADGTPDEVILD